MSSIPEFFVESPQQLANESGKNIRPEIEGEELDNEFENTLQQVASEQEAGNEVGVEEESAPPADGEPVVDGQVAIVEGPEPEELVDLDAVVGVGGQAADDAILPIGFETADAPSELVNSQDVTTIPVNDRLTVQIASDLTDGSHSQSIQQPIVPAATDTVVDPSAAVVESSSEINIGESLENSPIGEAAIAARGQESNQPLTATGGRAGAGVIDETLNQQTATPSEAANENLEELDIQLEELPEVDVFQESSEQTADVDVDVADVNRLSAQADVNSEASKSQIEAIENFSVAESSNNRGEQINAVTDFADGEANVDVSGQDAQAQQILAYPAEATQDPFNAVPDDVRDLLARSVSRQTVAAVKESLANAKPPIVQSITVEIHPAELGKLNIQVEVVRDAVQATIVATENFSADLLSRHKSDLINTLSEFGFGQANVDISHQNSQSEQQPNRNFQSGEIVGLDQASSVETQAATHVVQVGVNLVA